MGNQYINQSAVNFFNKKKVYYFILATGNTVVKIQQGHISCFIHC